MKFKFTHVLFVNRKNLLKTIMRGFVFFCCLLTFGFTTENGMSQNAKIEIESDINLTVDQVFDLIIQQTDYTFVYTSDMFINSPMVTLKKGRIKTSKLLKKSLSYGQYTYAFSDNNTIVFIKKTPTVVLAPAAEIISQQLTIKGRVTDYEGNPMPGVNVLVGPKEGSIVTGVATDFDGNYSTTGAPGEYIRFSYIGYLTQEILLENQLQIDIVLQEATASLEEVVLTGYQTLSKERATGSFVTVSKEVLEQVKSMSILDRLESVTSGINIVRDGTTGKLTPIIRGISSLQGNMNAPLFVVDGFPLGGALETINPDDIESVTILKDASAASIWGAQASNGVIIITTKAGKTNAPFTVTASASTSITESIDFSDQNWMGSEDYLDVLFEMEDKGWNNHFSIANANSGISILDEAFILRKGLAPNGDTWDEAQFQRYVDELKTRDAYQEFGDKLFRPAIKSIYNVSINGGSERNAFYGSLVYNDNIESEVGNSNNRIVMNLTDTYKFSDKLSFSAGLNMTLQRSQTNGYGANYVFFNTPFSSLIDANGEEIPYYDSYNRWVSAEREALTGIKMHTNPLEEVRTNDITGEDLQIRARFSVNYDIIKDLKFKSDFQYEKSNYRNENYSSMESPNQRQRVANSFVDEIYQIPIGTKYSWRDGSVEAYNFRNTLTYNKNWDQHKLTLFGGTEIRKNYQEYFDDAVLGYDRQTRQYIKVDEASFDRDGSVHDFNGNRLYEYFWSNYNNDSRAFSMFSNLGYQFKGKYTLNASFRVDQKNLFGSDPKYRFKPLWSAGIGWDIKKENFMEDADFVDRLRFRATYGILGNASSTLSPFAIATNENSNFGGVQLDYLKLTGPENPQLRWEEASILNIAFDYALFNNKLHGSLEYYNKNTTDLIGNQIIDPTNGWSNATVNYASMRNSGIELVLNSTMIKTEEFSWVSTFNFSYNSNKVTKLDNPNTTIFAKVYSTQGSRKVGKPLNTLTSYNYAGLDEFGQTRTYDVDGNIKPYKEDVTEDELLYHGPTVAPYYGSINTTARYKDFDLTLNITYKFGHVFREQSDKVNNATLDYALDERFNDRWQQPGDELTTRVPAIPYNGINPLTGEVQSKADGYSTVSDYWTYGQDFIHDAGVVRLRDIILGYNMPKSICNKILVKNLRLTAQVTNPYKWFANDADLDPELGGYRRAWRNQRTFTFGFKATF